MEYFFKDNNNELIINDDGIRLKRGPYNVENENSTCDCFVPYGAITKVSISLGVFKLEFNVGYDTYHCLYAAANKAEKKQFKELMPIIDSLVKNSAKTKCGVVYDKNTVINYVEGYDVEYYVLCNSCGNVLHFTNGDLVNNEQIKAEMKKYAGMAVTGLVAGQTVTSKMDANKVSELKEKLIDYKECKKCHSTDVKEITKEEAEKLMVNAQPSQSTVSAADELKKFKELLDMGVITQEEFDAKKKQLLGL